MSCGLPGGKPGLLIWEPEIDLITAVFLAQRRKKGHIKQEEKNRRKIFCAVYCNNVSKSFCIKSSFYFIDITSF